MRERGLTHGTRDVRAFGGPVSKRGAEPVYGHVASFHSAQRHEKHHVGERLLGRAAGEHIRPTIGEGLRAFKDLDASRRERDAMLKARLHARTGDGPGLGLQVDLGPCGVQRFRRA